MEKDKSGQKMYEPLWPRPPCPPCTHALPLPLPRRRATLWHTRRSDTRRSAPACATPRAPRRLMSRRRAHGNLHAHVWRVVSQLQLLVAARASQTPALSAPRGGVHRKDIGCFFCSSKMVGTGEWETCTVNASKCTCPAGERFQNCDPLTWAGGDSDTCGECAANVPGDFCDVSQPTSLQPPTPPRCLSLARARALAPSRPLTFNEQCLALPSPDENRDGVERAPAWARGTPLSTVEFVAVARVFSCGIACNTGVTTKPATKPATTNIATRCAAAE